MSDLVISDQLNYENAVREFTAIAVASNETERYNWNIRKEAYLKEAEIAVASNRKNPGSWVVPAPPRPPGKLLWVEAPPWTEGAVQESIKLNVGNTLTSNLPWDGRVADPTCALPPLPPPNPAGVADVGVYNAGGVWVVGDRDTKQPGDRIPWADCKTAGCNGLERVASWWVTGGRGYYKEVAL